MFQTVTGLRSLHTAAAVDLRVTPPPHPCAHPTPRLHPAPFPTTALPPHPTLKMLLWTCTKVSLSAQHVSRYKILYFHTSSTEHKLCVKETVSDIYVYKVSFIVQSILTTVDLFTACLLWLLFGEVMITKKMKTI